ncbi:MAG: ester cyclase [Pseudomonadota bacterium]
MHDFRARVAAELAALVTADEASLSRSARSAIGAASEWHISSPFGTAFGPDGAIETLLLPLRRAFDHCRRRDVIVIGGENRIVPGERWIASLTHYVGIFSTPLGGLAPSGKLAFLRSGEFYQIVDGQIVRAHIILDLVDLARQSGRFPFTPELGTEIVFPAPATQDGICPMGGDGKASLDRVEAMLADLHHFDPSTHKSAGQTGLGGYWAEDFLWYGPGGIGSTMGWEGFVADHRAAFLEAFPDRKGGNHYCRLGDGAYAAVSGWPSMTMTHRGPYLGAKPTDKALTLRVMDFYRMTGGAPEPLQIAENWVTLDYIDLFEQMGVDLVGKANALA